MVGDLILTSQKLILNTNYMIFLYGLFTIFMFSLLDRYMNEVSSMDFLYLGLFDSMIDIKHKLYDFFIRIIYNFYVFTFR